jgi:hypothetical protein
MRIEKLKNSNLLKPGQLLVVLKYCKFYGDATLLHLRESAEIGPLQFYRHRQEPVPGISRAKHGRIFRRPRTTNERRPHFSNKATQDIVDSNGIALKIRQKRKSHMLPDVYDDLSLQYQPKLERASRNPAKERRQHQPAISQPCVLGLVKPGAAYRERPTAYKIPFYKEIDRNLLQRDRPKSVRRIRSGKFGIPPRSR